MDIRKESIDLYEGKKAPKNIPYPGCSNLSTMVTTTACDLIHSKLFPIVWNDELIYWKGSEQHDKEIANSIRNLMRWVVQSDMKMQDDVDDITGRLVVDGTIAIKLVWKPYYKWIRRKVPKAVGPNGEVRYEVKLEHKRFERCFLNVRPIDKVYLPWNADNEQDAEYIIDEMYYTQRQLKEMQVRGHAFGVDKTFDEKLTGFMEQKEGTDRARMDSQGLSNFHVRKEAYPIKVYDAYVKYDWNNDGIAEECVFMVAPETRTYLSGKPLIAISKIEEKPWVIGPFLKRPGAILGKGVPELMRHLHKEMDAIHNQRIDAGNYVIAPWFFYRPASGLKPEEIRIGPGVGVPVDDPSRDVAFPNIPTSGITISFQEEKVVLDLIERLTSVSAYQLGKESEIVKSRATARGTLAIIQQGEQKFTILGKRVQNILARLLTKILHMYQEYLPPDEQRRILGKDGSMLPNIAPEDIAGEYDAYMVLDATAGSSAMERETNLAVFQMLANDPYILQNPVRGWEIRADLLKSLGKKDVEKILGPRPPMDQFNRYAENENVRMSQGEVMVPKKGEDHTQHLIAHLAFRNKPEYVDIPPEYKSIIDQHIMKTKALYEEEMIMGRIYAEQAQKNQGSGQSQSPTGPPGMGNVQGPPVPGFGGQGGVQAGAPGAGTPGAPPQQPGGGQLPVR